MENKNMTGNTEEGFKAKVFAMREKVTIDKKNLMIGDWVKVILTTSHPAETSQNVIEKYTSEKVQVVRCEYVMANSIAYNKYNEDFKINMSIPVVEEDVYPIPLTPKILNMNGFKQEPYGDYVRGDGVHNTEQVYIAVSFRRNKTARLISIRSVSYRFFTDRIPYGYFVHEFQQVLRLCGLNEIADNFKLK